MRIIISPAKKMKVDINSLTWRELPVFLHKTKLLCSIMQQMNLSELKGLWKCNDAIAELNMERLSNMELQKNLTPAILAYEGIQYQHMAPGVFTDCEIEYIQKHLRILSGFYGVLKPFDGVTPYRLEMQAKLRVGESKDLYHFWGDSIAESLFSETDCIINLASKEYSQCIFKYLPESVRLITCTFGEEKNGKIIEKGTICKMARGEMVRYMAENQIKDSEKIKDFNRLGFLYHPIYSDDKTFVFLKVATDS